MKKFFLLPFAAAVLVGLSGCAILQGTDSSFDPTSNEGIAAQAASRLNGDTMTARATLSVSVDNGMATLHGTVPDEATRQRALQIVNGTQGVFDVLDRTRRR